MIIPEDRLGLVGLVPVFFEQSGDAACERDVARLARGALVAVRVYDQYVAAGGGLAHRAGANVEAGEVADDEGVLRLSVAVVDRDVVQIFPPLYDRRVQWFPGGDGVPDLREIRLFQFRRLGEEAVLGRSLAEDRDPIPPYELQTLGGGIRRAAGRGRGEISGGGGSFQKKKCYH